MQKSFGSGKKGREAGEKYGLKKVSSVYCNFVFPYTNVRVLRGSRILISFGRRKNFSDASSISQKEFVDDKARVVD